MSAREIQFGERTYPQRQSLMRPIKGELSHDLWILIACRDKEFCLLPFRGGQPDDEVIGNWQNWLPYSELWSALAELDGGGRKWWMIGWRVRYAMDRAGFAEALAAGAIVLPKIKSGKNKGKHGGKLTWNARVLEVDFVAGRNKIKALDFGNYGINLAASGGLLNEVCINTTARAMLHLVSMAGDFGISLCKPTAAQLGWTQARKVCPSMGVHVNLSTRSRELERRAYFGGRCEAFRLGDIPGTCYSLDVKSCYANVCCNFDLPYKLTEEYKAGIPVGAIDANGPDHWIADVVLETPSPDYPLRWGKLPIFPVGRFATSLCWPELVHALQHNRVVSVTKAARYRAAPILAPYAWWYLDARERCDVKRNGPVAGALKAIFNSSIGYTAREKYSWVPWGCQLADQYWFGTTFNPEDRSSSVAAQVLDTEKRWLRVAGEPHDAIPYLHATISSWARVNLLRVFEVAGRSNILYCDTDGILCTRAGFDRLGDATGMTGDAPGKLVQRFASGACRIQGQKSYRIGKHWVQSGTVRTRYSVFAEKNVLTCDTGRADGNGVVSPFTFSCYQDKKQGGLWVNVVG